MTPWALLLALDAARTIAFWCIAIGFLCGAVSVACFARWRRLSRPEDTRQVRQLHAEKANLARQMVARIGERPR